MNSTLLPIHNLHSFVERLDEHNKKLEADASHLETLADQLCGQLSEEPKSTDSPLTPKGEVYSILGNIDGRLTRQYVAINRINRAAERLANAIYTGPAEERAARG